MAPRNVERFIFDVLAVDAQAAMFFRFASNLLFFVLLVWTTTTKISQVNAAEYYEECKLNKTVFLFSIFVFKHHFAFRSAFFRLWLKLPSRLRV